MRIGTLLVIAAIVMCALAFFGVDPGGFGATKFVALAAAVGFLGVLV